MAPTKTRSKSRKTASTSINSTEESNGPSKQLNIEKDSELERLRHRVDQLEAEKKARVHNNTAHRTSLIL